MLTAATSSGATTPDLLAFFPLRSDDRDTTGQNSPMQLTNAPFVNGVLYLNGVYEPLNIGRGYYGFGQQRGYRAIASVPGLKYESFTISVDFLPLKTKHARPLRGFERKVNEWTRGYYGRWFVERGGSPDNFLTGGKWYRWIGFNPGTNGLEITLNNQAIRHQFKDATIRLGEWHNLMCSLDLRRKQIITVLDGQLLETVQIPDNFQFEIVGTKREAGDKELTFVNYSNGKAFNGYAAHLRVFSRALAGPELTDLYSSSALERKSLPALGGTGNSFLWLVPFVVAAAAAVFWHRFRKTKAQTQ